MQGQEKSNLKKQKSEGLQWYYKIFHCNSTLTYSAGAGSDAKHLTCFFYHTSIFNLI